MRCFKIVDNYDVNARIITAYPWHIRIFLSIPFVRHLYARKVTLKLMRNEEDGRVLTPIMNEVWITKRKNQYVPIEYVVRCYTPRAEIVVYNAQEAPVATYYTVDHNAERGVRYGGEIQLLWR